MKLLVICVLLNCHNKNITRCKLHSTFKAWWHNVRMWIAYKTNK